MNKLLVVHIIVGLNVGGAEMMLMRLIELSGDSSRYRHAVISLTDTGKIGRKLQALGIDVHVLGMKSVLDVPRILLKLAQLIRGLKPEIVQTWMYHADLLGGIAARLAGHKSIIWGIRTTDIRAGGSRATLVVRRLCAWLSYWVPNVIICVAEASRQTHAALGYDEKRMVVVPNGFDLHDLHATDEQRQDLRRSCGFDQDAVVIGSLGRFNAVKDHKNFVMAAGLLSKKYPSIYFLLVGRDLVPGNAELAEWMTQTGHADRFVLLGERSDVPVCLSAMDIFCLHSRTEGFPNALGEAMAMGLPCVTTDVGDAALLLGEIGAVVSKEDTAELALGIEKMLVLTPEHRTLRGQRARQRIQDEFTLQHSQRRFESIYNKLLNRTVC